MQEAPEWHFSKSFPQSERAARGLVASPGEGGEARGGPGARFMPGDDRQYQTTSVPLSSLSPVPGTAPGMQTSLRGHQLPLQQWEEGWDTAAPLRPCSHLVPLSCHHTVASLQW